MWLGRGGFGNVVTAADLSPPSPQEKKRLFAGSEAPRMHKLVAFLAKVSVERWCSRGKGLSTDCFQQSIVVLAPKVHPRAAPQAK